MKNFYLLDYLKEHNPAIREMIDLLKYELDQRIYYYGEHFKYPKESHFSFREKVLDKMKYFLKLIYIFFAIIIIFKKTKERTIVSNAYFSVNKKISELGINVLRPIHSFIPNSGFAGNLKIFKKFILLDRKIRNGNFSELLSDNFLKILNRFIEDLAEYYKSIDARALIVFNDISFFEQLNIKVFKKLNKPSFIFLHGLPGRYNIYDENQTDYLIVWGKKIKQHYVKIGFNPDKILVCGHPYYEKLSEEPLRYSFDDVLIISKSLNGSPHRDGIRFTDRGNLVVYLKQVETSLKAVGVKQARLRVHPSENINWYFKFIDKNFFIVDRDSLANSLKRSTLVIGPTSTVFLESIYYGVNYLIYEPTINNFDLSGYELSPPFDGLDPRAPTANNEIDLKRLLKEKIIIDKTIFNDYIDTPFNAQVFLDLI